MQLSAFYILGVPTSGWIFPQILEELLLTTLLLSGGKQGLLVLKGLLNGLSEVFSSVGLCPRRGQALAMEGGLLSSWGQLGCDNQCWAKPCAAHHSPTHGLAGAGHCP